VPSGWSNSDYVYFMTQDGGNAYFFLNDRNKKDGIYFDVDRYGVGRLCFKITVSNDALTFSTLMIPTESSYFGNGTISFSSGGNYNKEAFDGYFGGAYTKASSDPNYIW